VLRIIKRSNLSRAGSQSSFHSCADDDEVLGTTRNDATDDVEYAWKSPTVIVHNILFGHLWSEFQGPIEIEKLQSDRRAIINMKPHSWFASQATKAAEMFKYSGYIYDRMYSFYFGIIKS
jgi:hypothetical protein